MAIILGRHQIFLDLETELAADASIESIIQLNSNAQLYQYFQSLAREVRSFVGAYEAFTIFSNF
jgi:hypothetical protein